jgi:hypothetical protein
MQEDKTGYGDDFHSKKRRRKGTRNKLGKNSLPIPLLSWIFDYLAMRSLRNERFRLKIIGCLVIHFFTTTQKKFAVQFDELWTVDSGLSTIIRSLN